jgi:DNA-binding response OmpR family regulator
MSKILLAEDNVTQAQALRTLLERSGYDVVLATDGNTALNNFKKQQFDIVLSDVLMPGLSGYELCQIIKEETKDRFVPVILITVLDELKDLVDGLLCGADNFIIKPYAPDQLLGSIDKLLQEKYQPGSAICDPSTGMCLIAPEFLRNLDRRRVLNWLVTTFDEFIRAKERQADSRFMRYQQQIESIEQIDNFFASSIFNLKELLLENESVFETTKQANSVEEKAKSINELEQNNSRMCVIIEQLLGSIS